jgi:hypothetical protein
MDSERYAESLERQLATLRADLERAVRDRTVLLDACKDAVTWLKAGNSEDTLIMDVIRKAVKQATT